MRVFKEYLLIQELLTVRSNTPTGKRLKVGFHKVPLLFLLYINDLPKMATKDANIALFADDKSIIVTSSNDTNLKVLMNEIFTDINKWFKTNPLSLNFNKTHCLEFRRRNFNDNINVCCNNHCITKTSQTNFWELIIEDTLSWKYHIDLIMSMLNSAVLQWDQLNLYCLNRL